MASDSLRIELDVETRQAIAGLASVVKGLGATEEGAKKTQSAFDRFNAAQKNVSDTAERWGSNISRSVGVLSTFTRTVIAGTSAHEANTRALRTLGTAYEAVSRQTQGAFSAAEALRAQQSLVQSGLRINSTELGVAARAAREYAIATGTEATAALEQLTGALRGGEAEGLRAFGVTLGANVTRAQAFTSAIAQLTAAQRGHAPEAQTMAEANAQLGRSWDQLTGSLTNNIAQWTDLRMRMQAAIELMGEVQESGLLNTLTGNTVHAQQNANSTQRLNNRAGAQERYNQLALQAQGIAPGASFGHARSMTDAQLAAANARLESLVARAPAGAMLGAAPSSARGMTGAIFGSGRGGLVFGNNGLGAAQTDIQAFAAETLRDANAGDAENRRRVREGQRAAAAAARPSVQRPGGGAAASYDATLFDLADQVNALSDAMRAAGLGSPSSSRATYADSSAQILDRTGQLSGQLSGFGAQAVERRRGENDATYAGRVLAQATAFVTARGEPSTAIRDKQNFQQDFALNEAAAFASKRDIEARASRSQSETEAAAQEEMRLAMRTKAVSFDAAANDNARRENPGATFRDAFLPAALETQTAAEKMAEGVNGAFQTMTGALKSHIGAVIEGRETIGQALKAIAHETLLSIAQEAVGRSLMSLGGALAALAVGSPTAPLLFASAAAYAGVAGIAGLGAMATASPSAASAGTSAGGIPAAASAGGSGRGSSDGSNITINVNGTVMDREGTADSIRELLNDSLSRGGVLRAA